MKKYLPFERYYAKMPIPSRTKELLPSAKPEFFSSPHAWEVDDDEKKPAKPAKSEAEPTREKSPEKYVKHAWETEENSAIEKSNQRPVYPKQRGRGVKKYHRGKSVEKCRVSRRKNYL